MKKSDITKIVKTMQIASFERYTDGRLIYSVFNPEDQEIYEFDVPVEETKGGTFLGEMKSIHLMRWIRKAIEEKTIRLLR